MQITVLGASGKVGRLVVQRALQRGYTVVAFVHHNNPFQEHAALKVVKGDVHDAAAVAAALEGSQAVVSCVGSWGTKQRDIVSSAVAAVLPAMEANGIKRIVTLTGSGAVAPDVAAGPGHRLFMRLALLFPAGKVFRDGEEHMRLLAASDVDWTTVRSPVMRSGGTKYLLDLNTNKPWELVARQAVASAIVDQIEATHLLRQAPIIHSR